MFLYNYDTKCLTYQELQSSHAFRLSLLPRAGTDIGHQTPGRYFSTVPRFLEVTCNLEEGMIALLVSLTLRLTLFFPIRNKYDKETCKSPDAKNCIVNMRHSAAGIAFLRFVSFFWISDSARSKKCSNLLGYIRKKLKM